MKLNSLRSKLVISVSALVIGSGLVISLLETNRFSKSLQESAFSQGDYLSQELALEATNLILINDLIALQTLLNNHLLSNPLLAYLFVIKEDQILAHTFTWISPGRFFPARRGYCASGLPINNTARKC